MGFIISRVSGKKLQGVQQQAKQVFASNIWFHKGSVRKLKVADNENHPILVSRNLIYDALNVIYAK